MTIKAVSPTIAAEKNRADGTVSKVLTVRILPPEYVAKDHDGRDIATGILCGGVRCSAGDLVQVTENEAAEMIGRGIVELAAAGGA